MAADNPCWKCTEREVGCHAVCERYLQWQKEHIAENRAKRDSDAPIYAGYVVDSTVRRKKKMKKGGFNK
jgi:hypothetical protein